MTPSWLWPALAGFCALVALWRFFRWADCDCLLRSLTVTCRDCRGDFWVAWTFTELAVLCVWAPNIIAWWAGRFA